MLSLGEEDQIDISQVLRMNNMLQAKGIWMCMTHQILINNLTIFGFNLSFSGQCLKTGV